MRHWLTRFHAETFTWHTVGSEMIIAGFLVLFVTVMPAQAEMRFQQRSLYMSTTQAGATADYTISFQYMSQLPVGSVVMQFCVDPIPYQPCVTPTGFTAANANLSNQTGEQGFSIGAKSTNQITLTRTPGVPTTSGASSYTLSGIVNSTDTTQSFSVRLTSYSTTDASGQSIDFGSVKGQVTNSITLETQVPPMLIFCMAQQVEQNCTGTDDTYYTDMGDLSDKATLTASSQMAVGTNAPAGFTITANGIPPSAGVNVIGGSSQPTASQPGTNQFGINLVANAAPSIGSDPEGVWTNAEPTAGYGQPNHYKYVPGDIIASAPNVSLMRKFTVSYILNASPSLRAGVYTTTITFIASGGF